MSTEKKENEIHFISCMCEKWSAAKANQILSCKFVKCRMAKLICQHCNVRTHTHFQWWSVVGNDSIRQMCGVVQSAM